MCDSDRHRFLPSSVAVRVSFLCVSCSWLAHEPPILTAVCFLFLAHDLLTSVMVWLSRRDVGMGLYGEAELKLWGSQRQSFSVISVSCAVEIGQSLGLMATGRFADMVPHVLEWPCECLVLVWSYQYFHHQLLRKAIAEGLYLGLQLWEETMHP